eukprot:7377322-Prymnesium_polylepis.1
MPLLPPLGCDFLPTSSARASPMILNAAQTEAPPCFCSSASRLSTSRLATRSLSGVCTAAAC